jgi:hypothetical protein
MYNPFLKSLMQANNLLPVPLKNPAERRGFYFAAASNGMA